MSTSASALDVALQKYGTDGYVATDQVRLLMESCGIKPSKSEILQALELDKRVEGKVPVSELRKWLAKKVLPRCNAQYNRLLVRPVIGEPQHSSFDLPGKFHTYGAKVQRDAEGAKEVILNWSKFKPTTIDKKKLDIVKMNRNAAKTGCRTPTQFKQYNKSHPAYRRMNTGSVTPEAKKPDAGLTFGITTIQGTTVGELIESKFNDASDGVGGYYPVNTAKNNKTQNKKKMLLKNSMRQTRASRGHASAAQKKEAEAKAKKERQKFKMKRFENIPSKIFS